MRKIITVLLTTIALVAGPVALTAAPASADPGSPKCMTKAEWRKVKPGMTRAQVKRITGIKGRTTDRTDYSDGSITKYVDYRQCRKNGKRASKYNTVWLSFDNYEYDRDYDLYFTAFRVDYKGAWHSIF
jgi:hypothetical protein